MVTSKLPEGLRRLSIALGVIGLISWAVFVLENADISTLIPSFHAYESTDKTKWMTEAEIAKNFGVNYNVNSNTHSGYNFKGLFVILVGFVISYYAPIAIIRGGYWVYEGFNSQKER